MFPYHTIQSKTNDTDLKTLVEKGILPATHGRINVPKSRLRRRRRKSKKLDCIEEDEELFEEEEEAEIPVAQPTFCHETNDILPHSSSDSVAISSLSASNSISKFIQNVDVNVLPAVSENPKSKQIEIPEDSLDTPIRGSFYKNLNSKFRAPIAATTPISQTQLPNTVSTPPTLLSHPSPKPKVESNLQKHPNFKFDFEYRNIPSKIKTNTLDIKSESNTSLSAPFTPEHLDSLEMSVEEFNNEVILEEIEKMFYSWDS